MRTQRYVVSVGVSVLALALVVMSANDGQAKTKSVLAASQTQAATVAAAPQAVSAPQSAPAVAAPTTPAPPDCSSVSGVLPEDLQARLESLQREMEGRIRNLEERLGQEVSAMESEKMSRLSGEMASALASRQAELDSRQQEAVAQAQELLQEAPQNPAQVWSLEADDDSSWLGIEISEVSVEKAKDLKLPAARGVLVAEVEADSPAAKAGLKSGDVITEFDQQMVEGVVQFRRLIRETPPGHQVPVSVWRDGASQSLTVEMGSRSHAFAMRAPRVFGTMPNLDLNFELPNYYFGLTPMLGISAEDLSGQLGAYFGAPNDQGILVREVRSGTPAEKAGVKAGDVILRVDDDQVRTLDQLRERLQEKHEQKTVKLGILRKGSSITLTVEIEQPKPREHQHIARRAVL